jgi:hypothetical protein
MCWLGPISNSPFFSLLSSATSGSGRLTSFGRNSSRPGCCEGGGWHSSRGGCWHLCGGGRGGSKSHRRSCCRRPLVSLPVAHAAKLAHVAVAHVAVAHVAVAHVAVAHVAVAHVAIPLRYVAAPPSAAATLRGRKKPVAGGAVARTAEVGLHAGIPSPPQRDYRRQPDRPPRFDCSGRWSRPR